MSSGVPARCGKTGPMTAPAGAACGRRRTRRWPMRVTASRNLADGRPGSSLRADLERVRGAIELAAEQVRRLPGRARSPRRPGKGAPSSANSPADAAKPFEVHSRQRGATQIDQRHERRDADGALRIVQCRERRRTWRASLAGRALSKARIATAADGRVPGFRGGERAASARTPAGVVAGDNRPHSPGPADPRHVSAAIAVKPVERLGAIRRARR